MNKGFLEVIKMEFAIKNSAIRAENQDKTNVGKIGHNAVKLEMLNATYFK